MRYILVLLLLSALVACASSDKQGVEVKARGSVNTEFTTVFK